MISDRDLNAYFIILTQFQVNAMNILGLLEVDSSLAYGKLCNLYTLPVNYDYFYYSNCKCVAYSIISHAWVYTN
jgi:hypothetical protein